MTRDQMLEVLGGAPLVASVQADPGTPLRDPATLARLGQCSVAVGVKVLRVEGIENIRAVRGVAQCPIIGLIKAPAITPSESDVQALLDLGCEAVATANPKLVETIHQGGALAILDVATAVDAAGVDPDFIATTLSTATEGPDLELVRALAQSSIPVLAEGRYTERWQVEAALKAGASGVVVGGALNDPIKQTRAIAPRFKTRGRGNVGAIDIGGTWMRYAVFSGDWKLLHEDKEPNPHDRHKLLDWLGAQVKASGVNRVGVSTAGIVDPRSGEVWKAKEYLIPDHVGVVFSEATLGVPTIAWGDGHATAWAHACLPEYAGRRVATLAIGTGVGCGFVQNDQIWCGPRGEYPRLNDLPTRTGQTYEDLMGGVHLTKTPTEAQEQTAILALEGAVATLNGLYFPQDIVIAGGVGASDWMAPHVAACGAVPTPLGGEGGLYGAAALALFM